QRLAIARTLLIDCKVILFDEITSALDNKSQYFINKTMKNLANRFTIIIVSHKISNIMDSDEIIVINDRKIEDIGTHSELITRESLYTELYKKENAY
ncbi:MAG: ABC transporter ATP-binding protein, partial [Paraclostridium sp.]